MTKLVEKFKTILPTTLAKILFVVLLFISCSLLSFTFVNTFNLPNPFFTILVSFGAGAVVTLIVESLTYILPKFIKSNINTQQYFIIFTLLFAVEIFILAVCFFVVMLLHPIATLFIGLAALVACGWFNILFEYDYFAPLGENKQKILFNIKLFNILTLGIVLFIWFLL